METESTKLGFLFSLLGSSRTGHHGLSGFEPRLHSYKEVKMDIEEAAAHIIRHYLGHKASVGEVERLADRIKKDLAEEFDVVVIR